MAIDSKQDIQMVRVPFFGNYLTRLLKYSAGSPITIDPTTDQYFQNGLFWKTTNSISGKDTVAFVSRPGVYQFLPAVSSFDSLGAAYAIRQSDSAHFACDNTRLLKNGVKIGDLAAIGGFVTPQFAETRPGSTTPYLCLNTGVELAVIDASDNVTILKDVDITSVSAANPAVVTAPAHGLTTGTHTILRGVSGSTPDVNGTRYQITVTGANTFTIPVNVTVPGTGGNLGNFPANVGALTYMNGYLYTITANGEIYNCSLDDPLLWDTTRVLTAQMYTGSWKALSRQNNFLLAFSSKSVQTFIDNANPQGSPLENYESGVQQIGCEDNRTLVSDGQDILWIGTTSTGEKSVYRMTGLTTPREIATIQIKNFLRESSGSSNKAAFIRMAGKNLYVIMADPVTVPAMPSMFVYDLELDTWSQWTFASATINFLNAAFLSGNTNSYFQNADGATYIMTPLETTDNTASAPPFGAGTAFTMIVQTERVDLGTTQRKFLRRMELVADKAAATANINVSYCDNDNVTFSTARVMDSSADRVFLTQGGNFRRRRFKFSYTGSEPQRWEAFELFYRLGTDG